MKKSIAKLLVTLFTGLSLALGALQAAPVITTNPAAPAQGTISGGSATFTVAATGTGTLTYQWRRGGLPITAAVGSSYTISGATRASAGIYDVVVTDSSGSTTSTPFIFGVAPKVYPGQVTADAAWDPNPLTISTRVYAAAQLANGQWIVAGEFVRWNTSTRAGLARLNSDYSLDTSWSSPVVNGIVYALAVAPDGTVYFGGDFTAVDSLPRAGLARLTGTGLTHDTAWKSTDTVSTSINSVTALTVQDDGKPLVARTSFVANAVTGTNVLHRLNTDGTLDGSFSVNITMNAGAHIYSIVAEPGTNAKIAFGGVFTAVNGTTRNNIARVDSTGATLDTAFGGTAGTSTSGGTVFTLTRLSDGRYLVGGNFTTIGGLARNRIAILDATTGAVNTAFAPANTGTTNGTVSAATVLSDGRIVVAGAFTLYQGNNAAGLVRLNGTTGAFDSAITVGGNVTQTAPFGSTTAGRNLAAYTLPGDNVLLFGIFNQLLGQRRIGVAVVNSDGSLAGSPSALAYRPAYTGGGFLEADGKFTLFGSIDVVGATSNLGQTVRIKTDGTLDTTYPGGTGFTLTGLSTFGIYRAVRQGDGKYVAIGDFVSYNGVPANRLVRINTDGSIDQSFNVGSGPSNYILPLTPLAGGRLILTGFGNTGFTYNGAGVTGNIMRLNADGSRDTAFSTGVGAGFSNAPAAVIENPDQRDPSDAGSLLVAVNLASGSYGNYSGITIPGLIRLNGDGTFDSSFNSGGAGPAGGTITGFVYLGGSRVAIYGSFTSYNGTAVNRFAIIDGDSGALDASSFALPAAVDAAINQVVVQEDGKFIVTGDFSGAPAYRLTPAGVIDTTFGLGGTNGYPGGSGATRLTIADNGSIYLNASIVSLNNGSPRATARFKATATPPTITLQPAGGSVTLGGTRALTVAATSNNAAALTYQWRKYGQNIVGATSATLALGSIAAGDAGYYDVVVSDGVSTTVSSAALLEVAPASYGSLLRPRPNFARVELAGGTNFFLPIAGGGFYAVGNFTRIDGAVVPGLARFLASGAVDTSYKPAVIGGVLFAAALQADGKLVIGGNFRNVAGISCSNIARLNTDGSLDTTYNTGTGFNATVNVLTLQTDGKIIAAGFFTNYNSVNRLEVARLNTDGSLDTGFGSATTGLNSNVTSIALQSDGKVIVGGNFNLFGSTSASRVARLNTDGTLDTAFATALGSGFDSQVTALSLDATGVVVAGNFSSFNGAPANYLMRLTSAGARDTAFLPSNAGPNSSVVALSRDSSGRVYVGGYFGLYGGTSRFNLARVDGATGALDTSFTPGLPGSPSTLAVLADGKIVVSGGWISVNNIAHHGIVKFATDGTLDAGLTAAMHFPGTVSSIAPAPGGQYVIGGTFNFVNDVPVTNIARVNADGSLDTAFATGTGFGFASTVNAVAVQPDGKILAGGYFNGFNGVFNGRSNLSRLNADGTYDTSFPSNLNGGVTALALQPDGKILAVGNFTAYNVPNSASIMANRVARLNADGSLDTAFATATGIGTNGTPSIVRVQPDGKILLGGNIPAFNGTTVGNIARLNADGSLDTAFVIASGSGFINSPVVLGLQSDGRIVAGGYFFNFNGTNRSNIASLTSAGALDTTFAPPNNSAFNNYVAGLAVQSDAKIVTYGGFTTYSGTNRTYFARVTAAGTLDTTFSVPTAMNVFTPPAPAPVLATTDGGFLVGGSRFDFTEGVYSGLVRLEAAPAPAITTQPVSQTAAGGENITFSVTAIGENVTYQWSKDGVALPGATGASLTLNAVNATNAGSYTVTVTNLYGSVTSSPVTLTGSAAAPTITVQPASSNWTLGQSGTLSVTATGTGTLAYQWRKHGVALAGATSATLTVPGVTLTDAGLYDVVVANGLTTLASGVAQVNTVPASYPNVLRPKAAFNPRVEIIGNGNAIIPIAGGGFYALGSFTRIDGTAYYGVARFLAGGAIDTTFTTPVITGNVLSGAVQSDGKLVIGGSFRAVAGASRNFIARLNTNGSLDTTFAPGTGFNSTVNAVALQSNGKIMVGGNFTNYNGTNRLNVVRLNADGSLDTTFGTTTGLNGTVNALVIQSDGRIVVGGSFTQFNGTTSTTAARLARLNADGTLDTAFSTASGAGFGSNVNALAIDANGKIVAGGAFSNYAGTSRQGLARINADGTLDATLLPTNAGPAGTVNSLVLDTAGNIVVGGSFTFYAGVSRPYVARVNPADGTPDTTFSATHGVSATVSAVSVLADGKIAIGGFFSSVGGATHNGIARLNADGSVDTSVVAGLRQPGTVTAVLPLANGQWLIGGSFGLVNDVVANNFARINANGSIDTAYATALGTGFNTTVNALVAQPDGKVYVGGNFNSLNGINTGRANLIRLNADGTVDGTFVTSFNGGVTALTLQANGKLLVGGNFTAYNNNTVTAGVTRLARLNTDGTLDTSFTTTGTGFNNTVNTIRVQTDGKILAGGFFNSYNGATIGDFIRLSADGTVDSAFVTNSGTAANGSVYSVVPRIDGRIWVGGAFVTFNGVQRSDLVLLTSAGALDGSYAPTTQYNNSVYGVLPQSDGKVVTLGNYTSFGGSNRFFFNRANANGTIDAAFNVPTAQLGLGIPTTAQLNYLADGSLLASGNRFDFSEGTYSGLVLLEAAPVPAITAAPVTQAVDPAGNATFSVTATGENLNYQWQKNGVNLAGANAATLSVSNVGLSDYASYTVVITNAYGTVTSAAAQLTPVTPIILDQPVAQRAVAGGRVDFHVSALGSGTLSYQWKKDGANVTGANASGATTANLIVTNLTAADAGSYTVTVSSTTPPASLNSSAAALTVLTADTVYWQQSTPDSADLSPARTVHDGKGGIYLPWTAQQSGPDIVGGKFVGQLARLRESDGTVDTAFKLDRRYHRVGFVAVQPDGKLIVAVDTGDASTVIRVDGATGAVDPTFNAPLFAYSIRYLTLQKDGRVVLAAVDSINSNAPSSAISSGNPAIYRLNADGSRDTTFASVVLTNGGVVFWPPVIDPNDTQNRIYIAGSFNAINGTTIYGLARLSNAGVLDTAFGIPSVYPAGYAYSAIRTVSFQSDGRIVATGQAVRYTARGSTADPILAIRFNTDGTFDNTFVQPLRSSAGMTGNPGVALRAVYMQADNKFIGASDRLVRFNADGSVDSTFTPHAMTPETFWISKGADGRLYVPVVATVYGQGGQIPVWGSGVAVYSAAGVPDFTFQTGGWGRAFYPTDANVLSDGRVITSGNFNRYGGTPVPGVALFGADGSFAATQPALGSASFPLPNQIFSTVASAGSDQSYVVWGNFNTGAAQLVRLNSAGQLDSSYAPQVPSTISLGSAYPVASPGGKLVLATASIDPSAALSGSATGALVRLNADGTPDASFTPTLTNLARVDRGTNNAVSQITLGALRVLQVLPDSRMLVLITDTTGNIRLQRLKADGTVDGTFNPPSFGQVQSSSGFTSFILDPVTNTSGQFNLTTFSGSNVITSAVQSPTGQVYLGGRFNYGSGFPRGLLRLNNDGSPDYSFGGAGIDYTYNSAAGPYVTSLVADSAGRIYAGGRLDRWNGNTVASGLFRLRGDGSYDSSWTPAGVTVMDYAANTYLTLKLVGNNLYAFGSVGAPGDAFPGNYKVIAVDAPPAVSVVSSPLSQTILPGASVTLSVSAFSLENISYQWRLNGVDIAGATGPTYTITNASAANTGTYTVAFRVTSSANAVISSAGVVTLASPQSTYLVDTAFTRPQFRETVAPNRITLAPDGKYYATWVNGGSVTGANNQRLGVIIRLNANGTLDDTFHFGAVLADAVCMVFQSDGKILIGGIAAAEGNANGEPVFRVFRLNTDGTIDSSYTSPKFGNQPRFMTLQSDGKVLVVPSDGGGQSYDGINTLARLNTDGTQDSGFTLPGFDGTNFVFAPPVVDGTTGQIYIAGTFHSVNGASRPGVARLLANGTLDTSFVPSGFNFPGGQIRGIALQGKGANAGKVLIAGGTLRLTSDATSVNRAVLRLTSTGAVDTTFPLITQANAGMNPRPRLLTVAGDDSFTIIGATVARYTADGVADTTFARPAITSSFPANVLAETFWLVSQPDGKQVITTDIGIKVNGAATSSFVRFNADGSVDSTFTPPSFQGEVYQGDLYVGADNRPTFIGGFNSVNGSARGAAARFNTDGSLDALTLTGTANLVGADGGFVRPDGKIIIGGKVGSTMVNSSESIQLYNADGTLDTGFALDATAATIIAGDSEVKLTPSSGLIVASGYAQQILNGSAYFHRLKPDGTLDTTFAPAANNYGAVYRDGTGTLTGIAEGLFTPLAVYSDGRVLVAASPGTVGRNAQGLYPLNASSLAITLLRFNADGSLDTGFTAPTLPAELNQTSFDVFDGATEVVVNGLQVGDGPYKKAVIQSDGKIMVGGNFSVIGGLTTYTLARLNADGTVDTTFAIATPATITRSPGDSGIRDLAVASDGKYWITGVFDAFSGYPAAGIVRLNTNGTVDPTFATDASYRPFLLAQDDNAKTSVAFGADGSVYLAGSYVKSGDTFPFAVTRLVPSATAPVLTAPVITSQPAATASVDTGKSLTLTVVATGNPAPTYQWYRDVTQIAGATNASYTINAAATSDAGSYTVQVANSQGTVTSNAAVVTVNVAPTITTQPLSTTVTAGQNATFAVVASGTAPLTYQWKKGSTALSGQTGATLVLQAVAASDAGSYTVDVSNSVGTVTSSAATLTVNTPPTFTTNPSAQTVVVGASVTFTAAASGSPTPTFQWRKNGVDIPGATSATYTIASTQLSDAGEYTVVITNAVTSVTSPVALLVLNSAPVFTTQPASQTVTAGGSVTFTAAASGTPTPTYQWKKNGATIAGATSATLTIGNVQTSDATTYTVVATNSLGSVESSVATLTVNTAPAFTTFPAAQTISVGTTATFTVAASGNPAPTFQWRKNGANISGATSATLTIANAQLSDAGEYTVVATNSVSSVTSPGVLLTFNIAPVITTQPVGQTVTAGANVTFTAAASGNPTPTFQWQKNGVNLQGATSATLTLNNVSTDAAGIYAVVATNIAGTATSGFVTLAVNPAPVAPAITTQPVAATVTAGTAVTLSVTATGTPAPTYQWQKNGVDLAGATNASLTLGNPSVSDSGNYAVKVTNSVGSVASSVVALTVNAVQVKPTITSQPVNQTVTAGNTAAFIVTADGSAPLSYQWRLNGNAIAGATSSVYLITNAQAANAGTYTVFVSNSAGDATSNGAVLTVNPVVTAPAITAQPAAATVTAGTAVTFSVTVTGTAPLTYVWQRNGSAIANTNTSSYTIQSPQVADSGSYNVVVSNSAGFAISTAAALTVNAAGTAPVFTTVPFSQAVTEGSGVTFTAAATGTPAPAYQWRKNGADIIGANGATYTIAATSSADAGSYSVKASNTVGDVVSAPASLTVNPRIVAPAISGSSTAATPLNSPYSYQIVASNSPIAYTATNLPAGLTLNTTTGLISGAPTVSGTFVIILGASNNGGVGVGTLTLTVVAPAPVINSAPTPAGTIRAKASFGYQITATNSPTSFSSSALPDGLTLNAATGAIIGSPNVSGTFAVTLTATNASGPSAPFTLTLNISPAISVPVVNGDAVANGKVGSVFVYVISASNSPTSFAATDMPPGVLLNPATGVIKGTPTTAGTSTMKVTASNADGTSAALSVLVTIDPSDTAPVISSSTTDTTTVGASYSYQIVASNTPTSYTAAGLPAGLDINQSTGLISGKPTTAGTSAVLLTASNTGGIGSAALLLTVQPGLSAPVITGSSAKDGTVGDGSFSYQIVASNTPSSFAATGLPAGLTLNTATGIISGSPQTAGIYAVSLTATNGAGTGAAFALKITIKAAAQAPSITSDASTTQIQGPGAFFSYQITATNGPLTGYSATGLPSGLTLDPITGVISGAPAAGTYAVVITASNAGGTSNPLALLITIKAGASAPSITSSLTADAIQRTSFTYLVTASNMPSVSPLPAGNGFTATGLPAGLALNPANGIISGSISGTGSYNVVLTATNDAGTSDAKTLVITVKAPANAPSITSGDTDSVVAGAAYGYQITATNSPTAFDASDRPAWLSVVTSSGIVFGTPTVPGVYTTKLTAANSAGTSAARTLTITVTAAAGTPTITSTLLAAGTATGAFSYQIGAGPGPLTAYYVTGTLPDGLGLDSTTGLISGTPTVPGTYTIPISAANAKGIGAAKSLVITIDAAPGSPVVDQGTGSVDTTRRAAGTRQALAAATLTASGTVNVPFTYQIIASNNPSGYLASDLPPGLALNPVTGLVSGTPAQAGTFNARIGATNSVGVGATTPITITIAPPPTAPSVTSLLTASGTAGTAFSYQILASNTPTSFNATGVPAGLSLTSTTGILAGTPTTPGTYHVTISANNNVGTGAAADLVLTVAASASAPVISSATTATGAVGAVFAYQVTASNAPTLYGATGLPAGLTLNTATGAIAGTPVTSGQYSATLTATNASGASTPFTLTLTINPSAATSAINSTSTASVVAGHSFTYVISATNSPVSYNISTLPAGLTADTTTGTISGIPTVPGTYAITLSANNLTGTGATFVLALTVAADSGTPEPQPPVGGHLVNLSSRANVGTGDNLLFVGFVIRGNAPKSVMIRGVGPALTTQGLPQNQVLADPVIDLYQAGNSTSIGHNDNWGTNANPADIAATGTKLGAFTLPSGSADAVIYVTLQPGVYSAIVYGQNSGTGIAVVEIYDADAATQSATTPRLVNLSSRGVVGTGNNLLFAGFVISGDQPKQVLIRAVGPTLTTVGVPQASVLSDPAIYLYHGSDVIAQNDNWGSAGDSVALTTAAAATGALALPSGSKDAALLMTLQPGVYSVIVAGTNNATGVAVVELYELQ